MSICIGTSRLNVPSTSTFQHLLDTVGFGSAATRLDLPPVFTVEPESEPPPVTDTVVLPLCGQTPKIAPKQFREQAWHGFCVGVHVNQLAQSHVRVTAMRSVVSDLDYLVVGISFFLIWRIFKLVPVQVGVCG